jgi:hypothetical protein
MKRLALVAILAAFFIAPADARTALVRSGLFDDFGIFTRPVEDGLRAQGYKVTRRTWYAADHGRYTVAAGHSKGADRVLRDNAKTIIAIDPTFVNPGCARGKDCTAYVGHANKFPFLICCGGYEVRGAKNIPIGYGHVQAPRIALKQILKQTARLK